MEEELYDSLEDEIKSLSDLSIGNKNEDVKSQIENVNVKLSDIVPFYNKETLRDDVKVGRNCIKPSKLSSKIPVLLKTNSRNKKPISNDCGFDATNLKQIKKTKELVKETQPKSYLKIFHTKIGFPDNTKIRKTSDTTRANIGDATFRTSSTGSSEYLDAKTPNSVTESEQEYILIIRFILLLFKAR